MHIRDPLSIALTQSLELPRRQNVLKLCISQREKLRSYRLLALPHHAQPLPVCRGDLEEPIEKSVRLRPSADRQEIDELDQQSGLTIAGLAHRIG